MTDATKPQEKLLLGHLGEPIAIVFRVEVYKTELLAA